MLILKVFDMLGQNYKLNPIKDNTLVNTYVKWCQLAFATQYIIPKQYLKEQTFTIIHDSVVS